MSKSITTAQLTEDQAAEYRKLIDNLGQFAKAHHLPIVLHTRYNCIVTDSEDSQNFKGSTATIMGHLYSLPPSIVTAARLIDEDPDGIPAIIGTVLSTMAGQQDHVEEMVASAPHDGAELITYEDGEPVWMSS